MKPGTAIHKILQAIETEPGRMPEQLSKATGLSLTHTHRCCRNLHRMKLIHIGFRSVQVGWQAPHYMPGEGEDAPMLPCRDDRRVIERRTGNKIASSKDMPGHNPIIDPLTARFLGVRATA
jgi:hypothetical protein